jgi:hypothetical protein
VADDNARDLAPIDWQDLFFGGGIAILLIFYVGYEVGVRSWPIPEPIKVVEYRRPQLQISCSARDRAEYRGLCSARARMESVRPSN